MRQLFMHWLAKAQAIPDFFDDWLLRAAAVILALIVGVVVFNVFSDLPTELPLLGVFTFSLVPILFIAGAVVFVVAILRS